MNEELCIEKHKRIEEKCIEYGKKLDEHDVRLDKIEQDNASFKTELKNLCDNLKSLTGVLRAMIALGATTLLGFFIYVIEQSIK